MKNLEDWSIEITPTNQLSSDDTTATIGNLQLIAYTETVDQQDIQCYINGENIGFYGAFIKDVDIPAGLNTDTDYLTIDGTDTNDAYRQNIREKTITLELQLGDNCDLTSNTSSLQQLTRLILNDKDQYNRPIPNLIEFSHLPGLYAEYIVEDTFDNPIDISTYDITVKLTVPAGTFYTVQDKVTHTTGYVQGIASINPIITLSPSDTQIEITEEVSGQKFNIGYTGEWNGKLLELDCEDRIVWLRENEADEDPVNLSKYVDFNSDWFVLNGEYQFTATNAVIQTIDYTERW